MKLIDIYERVVKNAVALDPRPKAAVKAALKKTKNELRVKNPYSDTRILFGDPRTDVKNVMIGIDIDVQELLLADRLRERGRKIDLVISHHPSGKALAKLDGVMSLQPDLWETFGISKKIAEGVMKDRVDEVARSLSAANHARALDAARLLGIPFMCMHTAADNCVTTFLTKLFNEKRPRKLKNVISILRGLAEYKKALELGVGPNILVGKPASPAGKIFVDMTGGTNGPDRIYSRLSAAGVNTVVGMHVKDSGYKAAKSEFINFVIAGHIASDNLGMNLLLDAVDPRGTLKITECSGFRRFRRK